MLLPVLSVYANDLSHTTPILMGLALGCYGLTQALFQIPFGLASDRINRKHVIAFGLAVFAVGSVVAGLSDSIYGLIIGRSIQGCGAISAATLALTADLTRSSQRTKAMAMIGICIGFSFMLALVVAPPAQNLIGVSGLFWLIAGFSIIAIIAVLQVVPNAQSSLHHGDIGPASAQIRKSLSDFQLMQLNLGIFRIACDFDCAFPGPACVIDFQGQLPFGRPLESLHPDIVDIGDWNGAVCPCQFQSASDSPCLSSGCHASTCFLCNSGNQRIAPDNLVTGWGCGVFQRLQCTRIPVAFDCFPTRAA